MTPDSDDPRLYELEPTTRFNDRASDYVKYRPDYPAAAFDAMLAPPLPAACDAADVGAGTGISARQLADRNVRVIAIEPNGEMRDAAARHPGVEWRAGSAEATGLPEGAVDLVLCAQAFHWFEPRVALAEFHRILRPGGRLALMWNSRDREDPLTLGYVEAIHAVQGEHPAERREFAAAEVDSEEFTAPELTTFPHHQLLDLEGLVGRALSASYVPKDGPRSEELRALLQRLFEHHRDAHGSVTMRYVTKLFLSARR